MRRPWPITPLPYLKAGVGQHVWARHVHADLAIVEQRCGHQGVHSSSKLLGELISRLVASPGVRPPLPAVYWISTVRWGVKNPVPAPAAVSTALPCPAVRRLLALKPPTQVNDGYPGAPTGTRMFACVVVMTWPSAEALAPSMVQKR